tara:strand:+ start:210 stop:653 length:444 start_codon:yes stop_codon:yes gene_type:complete
MKNNKIIAEFMGMTIDNNDKSMMIFKTPQGNDIIYIDELKYHCSWDWLMPVIEKIKEIRPLPDEHDDSFSWVCRSSDIEAEYNSIVEFIKEYNFGESMEKVSIFDFLIHINKDYKTCDRCCYDIVDDDGDILEHICIDDKLYLPNIK